MTHTEALVPTVNAGKYIRQLAKHWSHKLEVETSPDDNATIRFGDAVVLLRSEAGAIHAIVEVSDGEVAARFQGVVEKHLYRFAFREAPLPFRWCEAA